MKQLKTQCLTCHRIRVSKEPEVWRVEKIDDDIYNYSHTFCPICFKRQREILGQLKSIVNGKETK